MLPALLFALLLLAGCAPSDDIRRSASGTGLSEASHVIQMYVGGSFNEQGEPRIDTHLEIPLKNLVFRREGQEGFISRFEIQYRITRMDEGEDGTYAHTVANPIFEKTIQRDHYEQTREPDKHNMTRSFDVDPGTYRIQFLFTDLNSGREERREREISMPSTQHARVNLGTLNLQKKEQGEEEFRPITGYHLSKGFRELRSSLPMHFASDIPEMELRLRLLRFESDMHPAEPPYLPTPSPGSLRSRGIDFSRADTLDQTYRSFEKITGTVELDYELPDLEPGNYRIEIQTVSGNGESMEQFARTRDFSIMHRDFPRVANHRELSEALYYISRQQEYERLASVQEQPDSLQHEFDRFWAQLHNNRTTTQQAMREYFNRVEEANRMYSTHKEGWKTDKGMIYILFGPPARRDRSIDGVVWYYTPIPGFDSSFQFFFRRSRTVDQSYPSRNYVLQRNRQYYRLFYQQVDRWRRGSIR